MPPLMESYYERDLAWLSCIWGCPHAVPMARGATASSRHRKVVRTSSITIQSSGTSVWAVSYHWAPSSLSTLASCHRHVVAMVTCDVLVLMDEPAFTGCLVTVRLLGVIEAEQTEGGQTMRNVKCAETSSKPA